jgi:lipopolysaccharide biosynthesis glycosyltransferase
VDFGFLSGVYADPSMEAYATDVLGLATPDAYFMAAVLLMDLDKIRKIHPSCSMMAAARSRAWNWHDQDVLNHLFRGQVQFLDPAWDVIVPDGGPDSLPRHWKTIYETALASPKLFHFAGNHAKPWKRSISCYAPEFWEIARRTPFYQSLLTRLGSQKSTYDRLYGAAPGGIRRVLRKILPPPTESVQRDLRNVLDTLDDQTRMLLMLMRQLAPETVTPPPAKDVPLPVTPVFSDAVTVVCCGDERFVPPTAVLIQSLIDYADPHLFYDILYLHDGIRENTRAKLCALSAGHANISIRTCDIRPVFAEKGLFTENRPGFSPMAYARLMIPQILSEKYHRALYLDGDMIAFRDVGELFDSDLAGNVLGSTTDFFYAAQAHTAAGRQRVSYVRKVVGVSQPERYILSGMLLMDLERFRQKNLSVKLMEAAGSRPWQWHDQDVLNHVLRGQIKLLDPGWDCCDIGPLGDNLPDSMKETYRQAMAAPGIFHFAGSGAKPWERACPTRATEFWTVAARTPFYHELLRRLHRNLNTYESHYGTKGVKTPMLKRILKKILPPPVESVQRDLKTVLDAMDEQKRLGLLLMQQIEELKGSPCQNPNPAAKVPNGRLRFEFALAAHCNLNCAGCSHFSPLAQAEFPDFEESKRSFEHLSALFDGECEYIHLLGGEPLLNPRCEDYLRLARRCFPRGEIYLVTNGVLLPKQPDSFYETCRDQQIIISVTPYPISLDHEAIRRRCENFGVEYQFFGGDEPKTHFNRLLLDVTGSQDSVENYRRCPYSNVCLFLYRGRMYPCGIGAHMRIFEQHFSAGLQLSEKDSVDIFSVGSGADLLYQLSKPVPMCRYCRQDRWQELAPWGHSKKSITEWT